ncbi:MAG: ATP-binding protein [Candidatus Binatia bacterium]
MLAVLAVDDEPANQRAVRRALADECRVLTAGSGAEALALMRDEPVALVIADHRMPGMTGAAFLAETVTRYPAVVRVVLTGYPEVDVLLDAINRGHVYHVLTKPWDVRELRQVVRHGLERYAAAAERGRLLEALHRACARAQREAEQKTRLLTLAAHELGTPLHVLINALSLVRESEVPEAAGPWFAMAERAAEWLARAAVQLDTGARVGRRQLLIRPRPTPLGPLVRQMVESVCAAAAERSLDIATATGDADGEVDPHWIAHAVTALLINAVRFTPNGGRVRAAVRACGDWAEIEIADTGIGIAADDLAHIFEPFSAAGGDLLLHGSGRFAFGARGLGLGLAAVRGIAEAHGGAVCVESTPGQGSAFTLRVPAIAR